MAERQFEDNLWKYYRLLLDRGWFKQRWDPFIQLLVVYNSIFIPMSLAFAYQLAPNHQIADYCIDVLFIVDIAVKVTILLLIKLAAARIVVAALAVVILLEIYELERQRQHGREIQMRAQD